MNRRYTPEMDAWLAERYPDGDTLPNLCAEFSGRFGQKITECQLQCWAASRGVRRARRMRWSAAMNEFLRGYIPGHSEAEIRAAFAERFGTVLDKGQISNAKTRLGVRSGTVGGRFEKGHVPATKGLTWAEYGTMDGHERSRATCFRKGNLPHNAEGKHVGYERVSKDGYVEVKVAERPSRPDCNDNFRMRHHLVWEEANGRPVPPSTMIVFADGDNRNFDPENLVAVPRRLWAVISHNRIPYADAETLRAAMAVAEARGAVHAARCRPRECASCGAEFSPRFPRQRTCDACLGREGA